MSTLRSVVTGAGHYLPDRVVENADLEQCVDTTDAWIKERSGIERRHFAANDEKTSDLATKAARAALEDAKLAPNDIDAIVVATSTPDLTFPSVATMVQRKLGMMRGFAYDVQAVCAGFIYALANGNGLILSGQASKILVIGAETFSRIMNWEDRSTCVLFGDGAGALVLEAAQGLGTREDRGILATDLHSDGRYQDLLYVSGGVSSNQTTGHLIMQGREVFRHAIEKLTQSTHDVLEKANIDISQIDRVVPHQANIRIINKTAQKLRIPLEKVVITVQDHGNTSAASIPLAMSVAQKRGELQVGELVVTEAIGGGLAWGAIVLRW